MSLSAPWQIPGAVKPTARKAICRACGSDDLVWDGFGDERTVTCGGCKGAWKGDEALWAIKIVTAGPTEEAERERKKSPIKKGGSVEEQTTKKDPRRRAADGKHFACDGKGNTCKKHAVKDGKCWACYREATGEAPFKRGSQAQPKSETALKSKPVKKRRSSVKGTPGALALTQAAGVEEIAARLKQLIQAAPGIPEHASRDGFAQGIIDGTIMLPKSAQERFDRITIILERKTA